MRPTLADWQRAAALPPAPPDPSLNQTQRLRAEHGPGVATAAIELARARVKLDDKLPSDLAWAWVADTDGAEMATPHASAEHKAERFAGEALVQDLCCGIGADSFALSQRAGVTAVDLDQVRAWMCEHNAACDARVGDVAELFEPGLPFHADPSRRAGDSRRARTIDDYEPGVAFIRRLADHDGAIKLAPGVSFDELPPGEVEIVSEAGRLTQAVLWTGRFARCVRRASLITPAGTHELASNQPDAPFPLADLDPVGHVLHTLDPSAERAGLARELLEQLGAGALHDRVPYAVAPEPIDSPWATPFRIDEAMPWNEHRVRRRLREMGTGIVEVKPRGIRLDTDAVQALLRGKVGPARTVFVLRLGDDVLAYIGRRISDAGV